MAQIAYLLLSHKDPERVAAQARRLIAMGDRVAIHFDARAPQEDFDRLKTELADEVGVVFAPRRACGWGAWSLVAASLDLLRLARSSFAAASHFYLISGDCMPIRPAREIRARLSASGRDWIDAEPFDTSDFIKTGLREDRLIYRHWFNERAQPRLFYGAYNLQRALGLKRALPKDLDIMIGSQWWCLRRGTVERLLDYVARTPAVIRFFRTTWIPDETFFQTLVRHLVPDEEVEPRTPTFVHFTDYGQPVTFHDDHYDLLAAEDAFFARKISPEAEELSARLGALYAAPARGEDQPRNLHRLHGFLTARGRVGARHGDRAWEAGGELGEIRKLIVVTSKKWHVGKRFAERLQVHLGLPALAYVFDEDETELPDLGGLGATVEQRSRHRRAFLNTVCTALGTDRLAVCLDPARTDVLSDLAADPAQTLVIDLSCEMSDDYILGHAMRIGLLTGDVPPAVAGEIVPALRVDLDRERAALLGSGVPVTTLPEDGKSDENAGALALALGIDKGCAAEILGGPDLFAD